MMVNPLKIMYQSSFINCIMYDAQQSFLMSRLCGRATAQSLADFAQNLYMCTQKLERSFTFNILKSFYTFYVIFGYFFWLFLALIFSKVKF